MNVKRDYGDGPAVYPVVWHRAMVDNVLPIDELDGANDVWLGTKTSFEGSQATSATADGDVHDDAIVFGTVAGNFPISVTASATYNVNVTLNSAVPNTVHYGMWIDWNDNGTYDDFYSGSETTSSPATAIVPITVPATYAGEIVNVRLRADDAPLVVADAGGGKTNGEVEDFQKSVALPVELSSFQAKAKDCEVQLTWKTESEEKFDYFEIQWSGDGQDFESMEIVKGEGGNFGQTYIHVDNRATQTNYYRLKMIDLDGSFEYSNIESASVNCGKVHDFNIYPNPATTTQGILNVEFFASKKTTQLEITDLLGRTVKRLTLDTEGGTLNNIQIDISDLPVGTYSLQQLGSATSKLFVIQE